MTFRSLSIAVMSIWGTHGAVWVLARSVFCRSLAVCCNVCGMVWGLCPSPEHLQHSSTSLTSPSIPRENTHGNTAWTCSRTDFLRAESRHTRFNMNSPVGGNKRRVIIEEKKKAKCTIYKISQHQNFQWKIIKTDNTLSAYLEGLISCTLSSEVMFLQRQVEGSSCPGWCLCYQRQTWWHQKNAPLYKCRKK